MGGKSKKKSKGKSTAENGQAKGQAGDDATQENASKTESLGGDPFPDVGSWDADDTSKKEIKNNDFTKTDSGKRENSSYGSRRERDDDRSGGGYRRKQTEPYSKRYEEEDGRTERKRFSGNANDFTKTDSGGDLRKRENGRQFPNSNYKNRREGEGNWNNGGYKSRQSEPYRSGKGYDEDNRRTERKRFSLNDNERGRRGPRDNSNNGRKYRPNFSRDPEFVQYEDEFSSCKGDVEYTKIQEVISDLFEASEDYSLAHCVAEDMNMGSGIAVPFRHKFKRVDELLNQHQGTGGLAVLTDKERYIYYLVTKKYSSGKPTYATLFSSLKRLRNHVIENKVEKIAMPRIGCGLDKLEWSNVKFMLEFVFREVDVEIIVCNLEPVEDSSPQQRHKNCRVAHEKYPIEAIEPGTIILYFSSEDEHISEEMRKLDEKFHFLNEFRYAKKVKGIPIFYTRNNNYLLCGCIVKKTEPGPFDFVALQKCLYAIQKENKKCNFYYYAFQAMRDEIDACINYKIINILRNSLRDVEVYVCWPGDLQADMAPRDRFMDEKDEEKWRPKNNSFNSNWRDGDNEKSFNESEDSGRAQSESLWPSESKEDTSGTNEMQWDVSVVNSVSAGEAAESNNAWFQNCSTPKLNSNPQNCSFGSLEHGGIFSNSWSDSEEHSCSFVNFEQSGECDGSWSTESKSEFESPQNFSFGVSEREYCGQQKGEAENSPPEKQLENSSQTTSSSSSYQRRNSTPHQDIEKPVENLPHTANHEYESFQLDLESGSITHTLKEEKNPDLSKQYHSRVCFATEDLIIQSGIAPGDDIKPQIGKLLNQKQESGGLAHTKEGNKFLYCLIISPPNQPPTSQSVFSAIQKLREHASRYKMKKVVIPIFQPSDKKLPWSEVKSMFDYHLGKRQIEMIAAPFEPLYDVASLLQQNKNKLTHSRSALHQMKKKSVILYVTSTDGQFTEEMNGLTRKFDFKQDFLKRPKVLGDVIKYKENEDHVLYGCVARQGSTIDFEELRKCVCEVNEKNKVEKLPHVGIQAGKDQGVNFKILTVLLHCLEDVNVTMCWPGDLRSLMPSK